MTDTTPPRIGEIVPDFTVACTGGEAFRLSAQRGHPVVLYFYPKDDTPGCTQEGKDFRDLHTRFEESGAVVVGISRDSLKSHDRFRCKYDFPFELLCDTEEALCALFNVIRLKNMYGKMVRGIVRSTFLIDREGRLVHEWRKVSIPGHAEDVLAHVAALTQPPET